MEQCIGIKRRLVKNGRTRTRRRDRQASFQSDVGLPLSRRLFHWGPILAVSITATIGLTTTVVHVSSWCPLTHPIGFLDLTLFLVWNYLTLNNMFQASYYGGGYVKRGWRPFSGYGNDEESQPQQLQYCPRCEGFKAPRSHHCSKCDRCVMKMDHHCPWINNCVGHRNQMFFLRFLFFAVVGSLHACVLLTIPIYETLALIYGLRAINSSAELTHHRVIDSVYVFLGALLGVSFAYGVAIALTILLVMQMRTVLTNKSGIEAYICSKAECRVERPTSFIYPYDLGWRENWRQVWNSGSAFPRGNGLWWPIRPNCTQFSFSMEQLQQKRLKREWLARVEAEGIPNGRVASDDESWWVKSAKWLPRKMGLLL